jgi:hypothetical protein
MRQFMCSRWAAGERIRRLARCKIEFFERPFHAPQEQALLLGLMLIGLQNIAAVGAYKIKNSRTRPLRSGQVISRIAVFGCDT